MRNWFEVDVEGLRALQAGKPKTFVVRELVQNAWDERINNCELEIDFAGGKLTVIVKDDSPEGFKNLRDAYTLFGDTVKRKNAGQRGRFNLGEKQLISVCDSAMIRTTKGTVLFDENGRTENPIKTDKGTVVQVVLSGKKSDYEEMISYAKSLLVPDNVNFLLNGEKIVSATPFKTFEATLLTELQDDGFLRRTKRKTKINIINEKDNKLYELGLPVMDIDCSYSIDVQQKIPLSYDRDSVSQAFLKELYVQVLNNTYEYVNADNAGNPWVRLAMAGKGLLKEAIQKVLFNRYGEKVAVANPFDPNSIDEAIANGYQVVRGSEMSKEEWANIKENNLMPSTSDLFGSSPDNAPVVNDPGDNQLLVADYAKKIAKKFLGFDIAVKFIKAEPGFNAAATYGNRTLTFNITRLPRNFFDNPVSEATTDIIIHELGHENGHHTEVSYHQLLTKLGAQLTMLALNEPEFFR